ncbi:zinc-binding dehydrogenase [Allostreptomyces psammosilenae]|uniref:NADPH:quinone reductase-like Zn-dependent oxidoreductase n=1 Tax=Allostreptomyces psammosilenae TaxID=1892865 RepID=A0A852ZSJ0_9ACTN|nr:zinc-binding dehydrogenase [Allostreptomyces psammosilenae]NYI03794.1 NADPH:quinone reductase-like Zn-dependent oxidoreductase [Allostreptomyces psammosilenae]
MSVRALIVDPSASESVRLAEVPEPVAGAGQVLVEVHHASLNHGDLNDARSGRVPPGAVLGSDAAGVVVRAAEDGTGPAVGTRVVALTSGAFAERAAVDVGALAPVPDPVDLAVAAALPVAGLAALRSLRAAGLAAGKRVLVTGASGGVGRFAVQLAAHAGAHVIASVGSAARGAGLAEAGADEVLIGLAGLDRPVDIVIDNVGGPQLVEAWALLAPGGSAQSVGWTSGQPAVFPPYATIGPAKSLTSFVNEGEFGPDLGVLVQRVAEGTLAAQIGWRGSWERVAEAAGVLRGRRVNGKAVLDIGTIGTIGTTGTQS